MYAAEDDSPTALLTSTLAAFTTAPDRATISRVTDSLSTLSQSRSLRIQSAQTALRKLSRQHATLQSQHTDVQNTHSQSDEIVELDMCKFKVAKGVSDLEAETERMQAELALLKKRAAVLDSQGVEGSEQSRRQRESEDPDVLKLWIYRSLGVEVQQDQSGEYTKAVIGNFKQGDVHVLNIEKRFSKGFYADYLWQNIA